MHCHLGYQYHCISIVESLTLPLTDSDRTVKRKSSESGISSARLQCTRITSATDTKINKLNVHLCA